MPVSSTAQQNLEVKRKELEELALFLMKTEKELEQVQHEAKRLKIEAQDYLDQQAIHQALQTIHNQR